jgi:predicted AlkP superfamily phosphohydrolase/phosphomutase
MKLHFLGIDGLAASILFDPDQGGRWPNFERLFAQSTYGVCDCEAEYQFTGPSWTSIYTGQTADIHGLKDLWGRPRNDSRAFVNVREAYVWDVLNQHGLTTGVATMPITYPARRVQGWMIAGFPSPKLSATGSISVPSDFLVDHSEAIRRTARIPGIGYAWHDLLTLEEDLEHLRQVELAKARQVPAWLAEQPVDSLFVQYSCLDRVGHELNNYARRGKTFDYGHVYAMYDWFDAALLPRLLEIQADYLVVVSDHGWPRWSEGQGSHDQHGVYALRGADVPAGLRLDARNIDIMPTTLDLLGIEPPPVAGRSVLVRESELALIDEHLEGLGYLS